MGSFACGIGQTMELKGQNHPWEVGSKLLRDFSN